MIVGERAFELPFGAIGNEHLALAKRVLEQFDVLLIMESLSSSSGADIIAKGLGFEESEVARTHNSSGFKLKHNKKMFTTRNLPQNQHLLLKKEQCRRSGTLQICQRIV